MQFRPVVRASGFRLTDENSVKPGAVSVSQKGSSEIYAQSKELFMADVFVALAWCATITLIAWKYIDTRFKERQLIIQSGLVNEDLKHLYRKRARSAGHLTALKFGLLLLFTGAGTLAGLLLLRLFPYVFRISDAAPFFVMGCVAVSGGVGLVLYYVIIAKREKKGLLEKE